MENAIKYYYNLELGKLNNIDNGYLFSSNNETFFLSKSIYSEKRIKEVYEINNKMIIRNILVHEIVLNNFKQVVSVIDNVAYILMRVSVNLNKKISLSDVAYFSYLTSGLIDHYNLSSWPLKWAKKIDYYEQQAFEIGKKYMVAMEFFNYYVGLAENAITYINSFNESNLDISFCHIRASVDPLQFYNPFNFIIDYKVRDLSEYVKLKFFTDSISISEIDNYIRHERLNNNDLNYFYARLLFPTYYFDMFENIMDGLVDERTIIDIVKLSKDYEIFLHELAIYLSKFTQIEYIEWINKK